MTAYTLEVCSRAVAGREEDYARWYRDIHIGEVSALPGFHGGEFFRRLDTEGKGSGDFVAHYAVETDDPSGLVRGLFAAAPTMRMTDAIDMESVRFAFLEVSQ